MRGGPGEAHSIAAKSPQRTLVRGLERPKPRLPITLGRGDGTWRSEALNPQRQRLDCAPFSLRDLRLAHAQIVLALGDVVAR